MRELPRIGAEVAGYRLESLVSRGGMAVVYLAQDLRLSRMVALKILAAELADDDNFRERFLRESRVAASIDHPNVIPIYDAGEADGVLYIAMRHVEDSDLRGLLSAAGPLEIGRTVAIGSQVAGALDAAHRLGLVHRDVKPANVLLIHRRSPQVLDHVYLSDFGLAKHTSSITGLTATGQFVGTVSYTAPEQAQGRQVDGRTDIYALGCVLFECLAGRPPFRKDEDVAVVMAHISEPAPPVTQFRPDCPPELAGVVAKALAKAPDDRFQSGDELVDALRSAGAGEAIAVTRVSESPAPAEPAGPAPPSEPPAPPSQPSVPAGEPPASGEAARRRSVSPSWLIAAGLALAAAVAVAVVLIVGGGDDEGSGEQGAVAGTTTAASQQGAGGGSDAVTGGWRSLRDSPIARQQAAAAADEGRIWIFGGLVGKEQAASATRSVEAYDPAIDTWTTEPDLPVRLHHASAVTYGDELVVLGGWIPKGPNLTAETSDRVFALRDGKWVELPPLNHPRAAAAASVVGDEIIVVGGQADGELVSETEVFDGEQWQDAAAMPTPREHLAAPSDGRYVYAVGGRSLSADQNSGAFERYDPEADQWTNLPSMPKPSGSLGAAVVDGYVVAVGGEDPTHVIDAVQAYDIANEEWSSLPPMRTPRHGMGVVAVGDTLYAIDGALAPTHAESTSVAEALDFRG